MNRELYFTLLLFAVTVLAIWGFLLVLSPFLAAIAWALCLAAITHVPYVKLRRRWQKPRLAALAMVALTAIVILVPLVFVLMVAGAELIRLGETGIEGWIEDLRKAVPSVTAWLERHVGTKGLETAVKRVEESIPDIMWGPVARGARSVLGSLFTGVMSLIIMFATQFFVYTEGPRLGTWLRGLVPLPREDVEQVVETLRITTSAAVLGGVFVALIQGALGGIGYTLVGLDAPILWGVVTAFFSILPVGGSALIWGPMVIYLFAIGSPGRAWVLLIWCAVLVSGVDNVLRPWLLRRTGSRVHPMLLFFAILSGIGLFGMSGIVFGPLLIAVLMTLAQIYREHLSTPAKADAEAAASERTS